MVENYPVEFARLLFAVRPDWRRESRDLTGRTTMNFKLAFAGLVGGVALLAASPVLAQPAPSPAPAPTATPQPLTCADFRHNPDGSWSPLHPVTIGGVTMGTGTSFNPGVQMGGVDLAASLNAHCIPH